MIKQELKQNFLANLLGMSNKTARGYSYSSYGSVTAYVALATNVSTTSAGVIQIYEPYGSGITEGKTGYKRYQIGSSANTEANKMEIKDLVATNTDTLYFDEALADWGAPIKFFAIVSGSTCTGAIMTDALAYGEIVDEDGNPTEITVYKNQLPILRKGQLRVSLTETEATQYTVHFELNGKGTPIADRACYNVPSDDQQIEEDSKFYHIEWYTDSALTTKAIAKTALTADTTLYAKWVEVTQTA